MKAEKFPSDEMLSEDRSERQRYIHGLEKAGFDFDAAKQVAGKIPALIAGLAFRADHPFFDFRETVKIVARREDISKGKAISRIERDPRLLLGPHLDAVEATPSASAEIPPAEKEAKITKAKKPKIKKRKAAGRPPRLRDFSARDIYNLVASFHADNEHIPNARKTAELAAEFGRARLCDIERALEKKQVQDLDEFVKLQNPDRPCLVPVVSLESFSIATGLVRWTASKKRPEHKKDRKISRMTLQPVLPPPPCVA